MGAAGLDLLPVVSCDNINKMEGIVTLNGVLHAYGLSPEDLDRKTGIDHPLPPAPGTLTRGEA
jgi:hypothetical protein